MFSPGIKRGNLSSRKDRNAGPASALAHSPITPLAENRMIASVPGRPTTGTPAPWAPRLSVLARISPLKATEESKETDSLKPVFIGEFPRVVHDEQTSFLRKRVHTGDGNLLGGMDKETCLSWMICGSKLFIWSYLSSAASDNCVTLEIPPGVLDSGGMEGNTHQGRSWLVTFVNWDLTPTTPKKVRQHSKSIGVVMCNRKSRAVLYWPDIYGDAESTLLVTFTPTDESLVPSTPDGKKKLNRQQYPGSLGGSSTEWRSFNALIASAVPNMKHECVALASCSSGELWRFYCSPVGINSKISLDVRNSSSQGGRSVESKGYPRSLIWRFACSPLKDSARHFFLLTDQEIQCYSIQLSPDLDVSKLWSHEIVSFDGELGIKKDIAGQKRIWPLDMQVDDNGKVITVLLAAFCKDRVNSSSYTQYSLLTMQYRSGWNASPDKHEIILEKKAPTQEIIPKARVEDEGFLFSMRLKVGGNPLGSAVILSGDGTATVSHYYNNSTWLFQFSLPYDAGKVLDASVLPSTDDGEDGAWVVLTEKAGIWAIPEKAVVVGAVQPPERSLSRKGSSNEGSSQGEKRTLMVSANVAPRRVSSDAQDAADRQRAAMSGITPRADEEALVNHFFQEFLLSGKIDDCLEKLRSSGAFEREGEANVFVRTSKSIVDTLAKHWTTTRGAEILAMAVLSTQLVEKQQKHQKFLQFLAISKCHDELCLKQRHSLQIILEHGEKLSAMLQLRELQNMISQNRPSVASSTYTSTPNQVSGALWDLVQLVGERARRNTVLLMDRDNAEVFYSKVSDVEQVFYCLEKHLDCIISVEQLVGVDIQRACELSNACVTIIHSSMRYKTENHLWYPPPEGLMPWYCQMLVRNGMWSIASFMVQLMKETSGHDASAKSDIYSQLESLAEVLLEAYSGAITAKVERGEEHKGLLNEYWSKRDAVLNALYDQVKSFAENGYKGINDRTEEQKQETLRELSLSLLSIAKQHSGYQTMWNICCDINDSELLNSLMHESMGPQSGFSYFVFEQLYEKRQFSNVLRLGEEFQEELSIFLKRHNDLRWLHEIYLHQFAEAAVTLHAYALSQDEDLILTGVEAANADQKVVEQTLIDRRRNLNLAKIAAFAGGDVKDATLQAKVGRIEADLQIVNLQEEIMGVLQDEEVKQSVGKRLLCPDELIGLCLQSGDRGLALQVFDVFACTSSSFRYKNLLEECWRNAADQDPWAQLYQTSIDEGWSDEETVQRLRQTVLFLASNRCYGPQSEAIEDGFDQVLPLRLESTEDPESSSSVEGILMHHPDYSIAGKVMLMAIMLGTVQDDSQVEGGHSSGVMG